jgi:two-component system C4-dicarboxylate transport sensor histidine kinase DctB
MDLHPLPAMAPSDHDAPTSPDPDGALTPLQEVCLEVQDNGTGIVDLDKLFEPFWTTKAPGDGVGLGLAISAGIVKDLGGRLTARNRDDATGAIFALYLPLLSEAAQVEQAE